MVEEELGCISMVFLMAIKYDQKCGRGIEVNSAVFLVAKNGGGGVSPWHTLQRVPFIQFR